MSTSYEIFKTNLENKNFKGISDKKSDEILDRLEEEGISDTSSAFNYIQSGFMDDIKGFGKSSKVRLLDNLKSLDRKIIVKVSETEANILNQYAELQGFDNKSELIRDVIKKEFNL